MPYTTSSPNLPKNVKEASSKLRAQWVQVWNSAYSQAKKDGKSDKDAESKAFAVANGVLKKREAHMGLLSFGAKTKKENGVDFPASAFAYVPDPNDPSTWSVRLWESPTRKETPAQIDAAVASFAGHVPARDLAGVRRKVRSAWMRVNKGKRLDAMPDTIKLSACFSVRDEEAGEVHKWGKIFEAGSYPGHKFAMTADEVTGVPEHFSPVDLNLQHGPSILDGKLGRLEEVEAEDGILFGRVVVPIWLDDVIGDQPFTVSTEWDRATKRLEGLAIEIDPEVEDAVMFAAKRSEGRDPEAEEIAEMARIQTLPMPGLDQPIVEKCLATFAARHDTHAGQGVIQDVHDTVARYGAVCNDPNSAKMQSAHEATALQATHDMMVEHGAQCSSKTTGSNMAPWMFKAEPIVHDSGDSDAEEKEKGIMSKLADEVRALLARLEKAGSGEEGGEEETKTPPTPQPVPVADPTAHAEIVRLRADNARLQAERMQERAVAFAEKIILDKFATPAEKPAIIEAYVQAAEDDLTAGRVMLSSGKEGTRVDKLAALYAAKPKFSLTDERIQGAVHEALVNLGKTDEAGEKEDLSPEHIKELAEITTAGKATMAKNGAASS